MRRADAVARGLGWFSLALGAAELLAPRAVCRAVGVEPRRRRRPRPGGICAGPRQRQPPTASPAGAPESLKTNVLEAGATALQRDAPGLVANRDRRMGIDTGERRRARQDLLPLARPQAGVDAMKGSFQRPTRSIPGVVDRDAAR